MARAPGDGLGCVVLSVGVAASSVLAPLVLKVIDCRTAETGLNQLKGPGLASLALVAPTAAAGGFWLRRHALAPIVSPAPAGYSAYIYAQAILGVDYARADRLGTVPGAGLHLPQLVAVWRRAAADRGASPQPTSTWSAILAPSRSAIGAHGAPVLLLSRNLLCVHDSARKTGPSGSTFSGTCLEGWPP